mgnify:CR=1 FL=1
MYKLILGVGSEAVNVAIESGGNGRNLIYIDTFRIISQHLIWGVGLGGFPLYTVIDGISWPHNFVLEIICEVGLFGTILLFIIVFIYWKKNNLSLRFQTENGNFYFLILLSLGMRIMFSSDLTESIEFISAILAVSAVKKIQYV